MKALVKYKKPKEWKIENKEVPSAKDGEIKIQVKYAGICGSDIHIFKEVFDIQEGLTPGHEFSGIIVEIGAGIKGFNIGDRVTAEHTFCVCEICEECRNGKYQLCKKRTSIGFEVDGSFAEYVIVSGKYVHKLPEGVSLAEGAMTEPLACALHGVELVKPEAGKNVLVIGPGPIGIFTALCFKAYNCVVHITGTRQDNKRLEKAQEMGITVIEEPKNNYYDIVADCSGNENGINQGLLSIKPGGRFLQVGIPGKSINVEYDQLIFKEISFQGTFCHNYPTWERALQMEALGIIDLKPLISEVVPLEDWKKAFDDLINQEAMKILFKF